MIRYKLFSTALLAVLLSVVSLASQASSRWGENYFPNVTLTTQEGKEVKFFDDLIKDKIVVINFIYTTCADTCPLETAQLVKVQQILGDRLGKDIHFYSITIDPDHDTSDVLKAYKTLFKANWTFLTGNEADIIQLRRKLGLYIEEIQDGSNNHNVSMIIGNQKTGRWMKRSPFENPYVLADQLGNWLTGWKSPPRGEDYSKAPKLRNISQGEQLFRTRCATCHSITGKELAGALGPDLLHVTARREQEWLLNWLRAPDQMLANKDPIAMGLYEKYNRLLMPNMRLNQQEAMNILDYLDQETQRQTSNSKSDQVAIMNAWIREAPKGANINGGYLTLVNISNSDLTLKKVESTYFEKVEVHEMSVVNGAMRMNEIKNLSIPANGQTKMEPGGKHLMLIGPQKRPLDGQSISLTLVFSSGIKQDISIKVAANRG